MNRTCVNFYRGTVSWLCIKWSPACFKIYNYRSLECGEYRLGHKKMWTDYVILPTKYTYSSGMSCGVGYKNED